MDAVRAPDITAGRFAHRALFYAGDESFLDGALPFLREGVAKDEPMLVALRSDRIDLLRGALGGDAVRVQFIDMAAVGANPARIIPAWHAFTTEAGERPVRGIGEPIWPGRTGPELVEAELHEALLNVAFADRSGFELLCPYDVAALDAKVIAGARRHHPEFFDAGSAVVASPDFPGLDPFSRVCDQLLPPATGAVAAIAVTPGSLPAIRSFVRLVAGELGLASARIDDLILAVNELATNTLRYGGSEGSVCLWSEAGTLLCDIVDGGRLDDPLVGRSLPSAESERGRGFWLVHRLCDLVQVRSVPAGTQVRLHLNLQ